MLVLVTYDVSTINKAGRSRLRRIAKSCEDYGQRAQNSVFECRLEKKHWILLRDRLLRIMKPDEDSLRFYFLESDVNIEHHGCKEPMNLDEPLIF